MSFLLGCALWGYKGWEGELFPKNCRAADYLKLYSAHFATVEGNTTFYSVPDEKTIARWVNETPASFRFCPKFPRDVTHQGSLKSTTEAALAFVERMQGLGDRLGLMFAQLPPSYGPAQFDDLIAFLTALPRTAVQFAVEARHPQWFQASHADRLNQALETLGVGRVILDTRPVYEVDDDPQIGAPRKKPRLPVVFVKTADFCLIRYISHPQWELNLRFLQDWLEPLGRWLQDGTQIYFIVHCPQEERSPSNARSIQYLLEQHAIAVPPLPWDQLEQPPVQLKLL